jgi:hypothetical protein
MDGCGMRQRAFHSSLSFRSFTAVSCLLVGAAIAAEELPQLTLAPAEELETQGPAKHYVGPQACVECHQAEYQVWSQTNHATNAYDLLRTSSNAKRYAANLGLDENHVARNPRCLSCHATPQSPSAQATGVQLGVTCESCHSTAGGEEGWLNIHATYGLSGERRAEETPEHRQQRIERCRAAGQSRCDDLYSLAKTCYECHLVGDEQLVVRGGHHPGNTGFEMTGWFDEHLRHNLFLNPQRNGTAPSLWEDPLWRPGRQPGRAINRRRVMYVVATLVDLEVSLRNRGRATHASFASAAATRIVAASSRLKLIAEGGATDDLSRAIDAVGPLEPDLFAPPADKDAPSFVEAADLVRGIAMNISAADEGERFPAVDRLLGTHSKPAGSAAD